MMNSFDKIREIFGQAATAASQRMQYVPINKALEILLTSIGDKMPSQSHKINVAFESCDVLTMEHLWASVEANKPSTDFNGGVALAQDTNEGNSEFPIIVRFFFVDDNKKKIEGAYDKLFVCKSFDQVLTNTFNNNKSIILK